LGDGSNDLIMKLREKCDNYDQSGESDESGLQFFGLRFGKVLLCIWHIPMEARYSTLCQAYAKSTFSNVVVFTYRANKQASLNQAQKYIEQLCFEEKQHIVLLELHETKVSKQYAARALSERAIVTWSLSLQDVYPFLSMLIDGLGCRSEPSEEELIEIPLDDDEPLPQQTSRPPRLAWESFETLCMFL